MLPDGGTVNRFQKEGESYEDLTNFILSAKYLVNLYKNEHEPAVIPQDESANATTKTEELWMNL